MTLERTVSGRKEAAESDHRPNSPSAPSGRERRQKKLASRTDWDGAEPATRAKFTASSDNVMSAPTRSGGPKTLGSCANRAQVPAHVSRGSPRSRVSASGGPNDCQQTRGAALHGADPLSRPPSRCRPLFASPARRRCAPVVTARFTPLPSRLSTRPRPSCPWKPPSSFRRDMCSRRPRLQSSPSTFSMASSGCAFIPTSHTFQILNRSFRPSNDIVRPFAAPVRFAFVLRPSRRPSPVRFLASADRAAADDAAKLPDDSLQPFKPSQSPLQPSASSSIQSQPPESDANLPHRPEWAPRWLPDFFLDLRRRPWLQLAIMLPLYAFHLFFLSTKGFKFKNPIIPNNKNLFQSIGYESIAGAVVAIVMLLWRRYLMPRAKSQSFLPNVLDVENPPWKVPRDAKRRIGRTTILLVVAYLISGYGAVFSEQVLYLLAGSGVPLTVATTRAWKVLLGHLMWVYMGVGILRRLKPFFPPKGTWLRWKWRSNWLWWAIGGYYVSALFFNIADVVNQLVLPASLFEEETVVSKLINPENKDRVAMAVGSIGPCVSAPVFEEVLYRGFLLPALACFLPMWAAIPASSVLFAIHHLNPTMILPLSMLGFIWANLYSQSRNLTVTILIHAMWNSRVFLGSLLGLGTFTDFE